MYLVEVAGSSVLLSSHLDKIMVKKLTNAKTNRRKPVLSDPL
jgi:hypothetical protein